MRPLTLIGIVLLLAGLGGSVRACMSIESGGVQRTAETAQGGSGSTSSLDDGSSGAMVLGMLSGLALVAGIGFMTVGIGRWQNPKPSLVRPANPFSDQPIDHVADSELPTVTFGDDETKR